MAHCKNWVWFDVDYLKEHYKNKTNLQLGDHLGRTERSIESKLSRLGLTR
jgi:hypothetical protein